ncbi:alpha/beta fold hydrolase [Mycobacterium sp. 236(2023)]|uniref:alpha/beta fold hydrolase n=1 Tax=Mycobacterium sp. 236(2023) TaxID=3038163 RepID=UPI00241565EA|nr:alpha/beta fold hydrolase [Mycobacterium sp. 236(2023)]MDG4667087.1 alpha/beta fold hydrolase [Mycobacterium sp. 236(2023)]
MREYRRGAFTFDVLDEGSSDGTPVVLLHGFPQFNTSWTPVMTHLTGAGYRCLAPNQRGYSAGARPRRRRDYRGDQLVADIVALIDAVGADTVHLVGHDWGAAAAWATASLAPNRIRSLTAISVPHPAAFFAALTTSRQFLASWYMYFFQLPRIPEWFLTRKEGEGAKWLLEKYFGQSPEAAARDVAAIRDTAALTTALNWYRAVPFNPPNLTRTRTTVPTMFVWSDGDAALLEKGARLTAQHVAGPYRFEVLEGASHWLPDECPDKLAGLLLDWFAAHP